MRALSLKGLEMNEHEKETNGHEKEELIFEIAVVIPKRIVQEKDEGHDCVDVLVEEFTKVGLIVEKVLGVGDEFIKVRRFKYSLYIYMTSFYTFLYLILCIMKLPLHIGWHLYPLERILFLA